MSILVNNKEMEYKEGLCALDLVKSNDKSIISCKINHKLRDLSYKLEDGDEVDLLGFDDENGNDVIMWFFQNELMFVELKKKYIIKTNSVISLTTSPSPGFKNRI